MLVEVAQGFVGATWNLAGELFLTELGFANFDLEFFDVDRSQAVFAEQALVDDDCILKVAAVVGHEGHDHVLTQGQFALVGATTVGQDLTLGDLVALVDDGLLVEAGALVQAVELTQVVFIVAGWGA